MAFTDGRVGYQALAEFVKKHGHATVKLSDGVEDYLYHWIHNQRKFYQLHLKLHRNMATHRTHERIDALNKLGMVWDALEHEWDKKFEELKKF
jgi:Helicase associated domain